MYHIATVIVDGVEYEIYSRTIPASTKSRNVECEEILKELSTQHTNLEKSDKRLSNDRFISSAKSDVVEMERKKWNDALTNITLLENRLARILGIET